MGKRSICTIATCLSLSPHIVGNQRRAHLIPFLCGVGCKRTLILEMEERFLSYLIIIIIIRLYIAIHELTMDVNTIESIN